MDIANSKIYPDIRTIPKLDSSIMTLLGNFTSALAEDYVYKINSIIICNRDVSNPIDVTIDIYSPSGVVTYIAHQISVPAKDKLDLINTSFYLLENWQIRGLASVASSLDCTISFERLS